MNRTLSHIVPCDPLADYLANLVARLEIYLCREFCERAAKTEGIAFLRNVVVAFPSKVYKVPSDSGMAFADLPKNRADPTRRWLGPRIFDHGCAEPGVEHRPTKAYHPWANHQAEPPMPVTDQLSEGLTVYPESRPIFSAKARHRRLTATTWEPAASAVQELPATMPAPRG
jgi:hypothetical protein